MYGVVDPAKAEKMLDEIVERTDGIPLFVEELTKAVLEAETDIAARRTVAARRMTPRPSHGSARGGEVVGVASLT